MAIKLIKIEVAVGDLKVGDEFIDHTESGDRYTVSWIGKGSEVEAYRNGESNYENVNRFPLEDLVQIERCDYGMAA